MPALAILTGVVSTVRNSCSFRRHPSSLFQSLLAANVRYRLLLRAAAFTELARACFSVSYIRRTTAYQAYLVSPLLFVLGAPLSWRYHLLCRPWFDSLNFSILNCAWDGVQPIAEPKCSRPTYVYQMSCSCKWSPGRQAFGLLHLENWRCFDTSVSLCVLYVTANYRCSDGFLTSWRLLLVL